MSRYLKVLNSQLVWSDTNKPCYEIGAHCWSAFARLYTNPSNLDNGLPVYERAFALMEQYGIQTAHIVANTFGQEALTNSTAGFFINQTAFLNNMQLVLDSAESHGISLCLLLFLSANQMPQYSGVSTSTISNVRTAWTTAGATRTNAASYISAIVTAFKDHPAVAMWECFGELSDTTYSTSSGNWGFGTGADREPARTQMHDSLTWVAQQIRLIDSNRAISTGNGGFMTAISPVTSVSTSIGYATQVIADTPDPCDVASIHPYPFISLENRYLNPSLTYGDVKNRQAKPLIFGEFGPNDHWWTGQRSGSAPYNVDPSAIEWTATESTPQTALDRMLSAIKVQKVPLSFIWDVNLPFLGVNQGAYNGTFYNQDGWPMWYGVNEWRLSAIQTAQATLDGFTT